MGGPNGGDRGSNGRSEVELVALLAHDLGRYVRLQQGWMPPDASLQARREALIADVLQTRRGPDGVTDAFGLWASFAEALPRPPAAVHPALGDVAAALDALRALQPFDALERDGLDQAHAACHAVADGVRTAARALRGH